MEHQEISRDRFHNPASNRDKHVSENRMPPIPIVHYTTNPLTDLSSYLDEPPPYEPLETNIRSPNPQYIYAHVSPNKRSCSCWYRCAIISIIMALIMISVIFSNLLTVTDKTYVSPCNISSSNGKSCSRNSFTNVQLANISSFKPGLFQFQSYSFDYVGQSKSDVITFSFDKGSSWYLDDLSVVDTLTNTELIVNGNFESGALDEYCVCSGDLFPSKVVALETNTGSYAYAAWNHIHVVKLSQALNTIPGRRYKVTFWFYNYFNSASPFTVFMSRANQYSPQSIFLLLLIVFLVQIK